MYYIRLSLSSIQCGMTAINYCVMTTTNINIGDARKLIKECPDQIFDCIMTSPPYWKLRDYECSNQMGQEPTPEEYIEVMLNLFNDIKSKLKNTGNCFINLGDSYAQKIDKIPNIKSKSLYMIPERFAWGMIECGWILRNKIIWYKPNHMRESVTDRLTKSYEIIYHFVKQQKYYYNLDTIRIPCKTTSDNKSIFGGNKYSDIEKFRIYSGKTWNANSLGKNPGDVWRISNQPYPKAHFATFPIKLIEKPILAGCPPNGHVLDPFGGSGRVAKFCQENNRNCTIFELNPKYEILINE